MSVLQLSSAALVLNRKVSVVQQPVLYLDVSVVHQPVLPPDLLYSQLCCPLMYLFFNEPVLSCQVPVLQQPVMHQCCPGKRLVVHLEVSVYYSLCSASVRVLLRCTWTCLSPRACATPVRCAAPGRV